MRGKIAAIGVLISLFLVSAVLAVVTPISPPGDVTTNAGTYTFLADSDNPLWIPTPPTLYLDLGFNGTKAMDCIWNGTASLYNCNLTGYDISGFEGVFNVDMTDASGTYPVGNMTIDHYVLANSFNFAATANNVSYTPGGCVDTISGVASEVGQYSNDNWATVTNMSSNPEILPNGTWDFRGFCVDNAGNTNMTGTTSFVLPASPPVLTTVIDLPSRTICSGGFPCTEVFDGAGNPMNVALKLTFDKAANITIVFDGGAPVGPSSAYVDHVVSFNYLTTGIHTIDINATDGTNYDDYRINMNVTNTSGSGSVNITIRNETASFNETNASVSFTGNNTVLKNNVLPGDFATVRYELMMKGGNFTKFSFNGSSGFVPAVLVYCSDNYDGNSTVLDVINPADSDVFNISMLDGNIDDNKFAITCPIKESRTGDFYLYDVYVRYNISASASGGSLAGNLGVGLYANATG